MPLRGWTLFSTCAPSRRQHRAQHAANLLWAAHVAHHSSPGAKQMLAGLSWCHQLASMRCTLRCALDKRCRTTAMNTPSPGDRAATPNAADYNLSTALRQGAGEALVRGGAPAERDVTLHCWVPLVVLLG